MSNGTLMATVVTIDCDLRAQCWTPQYSVHLIRSSPRHSTLSDVEIGLLFFCALLYEQLEDPSAEPGRPGASAAGGLAVRLSSVFARVAVAARGCVGWVLAGWWY